MEEIYDLTFSDTAGRAIKLSGYRGKVILVVNTATRCGFAGQFRELEALYQQYNNRGLVVIGFPCNQFADQEPETNETMAGVCLRDFGVTFTLSEIIDVNGPETHPVFKYLKNHSKSLLGKDIKWNFTKFLVSPDGKEIRRYAPSTKPSALNKDVEKLLSLANQ